MAGKERDFMGLKARWVMWLDVPKEFRKHQSVAYKMITGKRDTQFGINKGSPAFILDDPDGNSWVMKSVSLIVDPNQAYESLKDLGSRLQSPPGWKFRTWCSGRTWCLRQTTVPRISLKTSWETRTTGVGGPYSNYKP